MKIYTKTNAHHGFFDRKHFFDLKTCKQENNCIYWYDQHDSSVRGTPFRDFLNHENWIHCSKDPTAKILIFYPDEYYNRLDVDDWANTIKKYNINPNQIYIVAIDENFKNWTIKTLESYQITGVNITSYNYLLQRVQYSVDAYNINLNINFTKKFSALSRNYGMLSKPYRLFLFTELFCNNLLDDFYFTFNIINPYGEIITYSKDKIKNDLVVDFNYTLTPALHNWVDNMPYQLEIENVLDKMSNTIYKYINESAIHITVESHFDPFWMFRGHAHENIQAFSPAFPTEKTYEPIALKKPFIIFSTPYFLQEFKTLGFKTFSPYIDEDYDLIVNNIDRTKAIVKEVQRLNSLSQNDFIALLRNCQEICEHNFNVFKQICSNNIFINNFDFINHLKDNGQQIHF